MKKFLFIGFFLLLTLNINSGTNKEIIKKVTTEDLIKDQLYKLKEITDKQLEIDLLLLRCKMYNKFTLYDKIKVTEICQKLEINEKDLYRVIYVESRGNTKAINKKSKATGIIQWLPSTAKRLNTTTDSLYNMNMSEQLDYVYEYYKPICKKYKLNNYQDTYLAVFYPLALGRNKNHIIGHKGSLVVKLNETLDLNNDGIITVGEINKI